MEPPNEWRLSCGALKNDSFLNLRAPQLQAHVRRRARLVTVLGPYVLGAIPPNDSAGGLRLLDQQDLPAYRRHSSARVARLGVPNPKPAEIVAAVTKRCARAQDVNTRISGMNDRNSPFPGFLLHHLDRQVDEAVFVKLAAEQIGVQIEEKVILLGVCPPGEHETGQIREIPTYVSDGVTSDGGLRHCRSRSSGLLSYVVPLATTSESEESYECGCFHDLLPRR